MPCSKLLINTISIPICGFLSRGFSSAYSSRRGFTSYITAATESTATAITASYSRYGIVCLGHTRIRTLSQRRNRLDSVTRSATGEHSSDCHRRGLGQIGLCEVSRITANRRKQTSSLGAVLESRLEAIQGASNYRSGPPLRKNETPVFCRGFPAPRPLTR